MLKSNFFEKETFENICLSIFSNTMPFYIQSGEAKNGDGGILLTHVIIHGDSQNSSLTDFLLNPIIKSIKKVDSEFFKIIRVKINCYPKSEKPRISNWHIDLPGSYHKVCLVNLNNNNGYTDFKNKNLIQKKSLENTALFFDGKEEHRSVSQTNTAWRYNINIDYE